MERESLAKLVADGEGGRKEEGKEGGKNNAGASMVSNCLCLIPVCFVCAYRRAPSNDLPHPATRSRGRRRRSPATRRGLQRAGKEVHEASGTV